MLGQPEGFSSCAIVGASGSLLEGRAGDEIDRHQLVIRTNLAPVGGFEAAVGTKTSVRVMNTEALHAVLLERACPELRAGRDSFCPEYAILVNSKVSGGKLRRALEQACHSRMLWVPSSDPVVAFFAAHHKGRNVMTGAWGIALAMHLCPRGLDVYGFTHAGGSPHTPYHYYDDKVARSLTDSLDAASVALADLARQQPRCVRVHSPVGRFTELSTCPHTRNIVDRFVDGVDHALHPREYAHIGLPSFRSPVDSCPTLPQSSSHGGSQCVPCTARAGSEHFHKQGYVPAQGCEEELNSYCTAQAACNLAEHTSCTGIPALYARLEAAAGAAGGNGVLASRALGGTAPVARPSRTQNQGALWRCCSPTALSADGLSCSGEAAAAGSYCIRDEQLRARLASCVEERAAGGGEEETTSSTSTTTHQSKHQRATISHGSAHDDVSTGERQGMSEGGSTGGSKARSAPWYRAGAGYGPGGTSSGERDLEHVPVAVLVYGTVHSTAMLRVTAPSLARTVMRPLGPWGLAFVHGWCAPACPATHPPGAPKTDAGAPRPPDYIRVARVIGKSKS